MMIRARAAITMIAHSVIQIANRTRRFRCMFGQIKRGEVFYTTQRTSGATRMSIGSGMSIAIVWGWSAIRARRQRRSQLSCGVWLLQL